MYTDNLAFNYQTYIHTCPLSLTLCVCVCFVLFCYCASALIVTADGNDLEANSGTVHQMVTFIFAHGKINKYILDVQFFFRGCCCYFCFIEVINKCLRFSDPVSVV